LCRDNTTDSRSAKYRYAFCSQSHVEELSLPGKLMGYEALGRAREEWAPLVRYAPAHPPASTQADAATISS